jgi:hypothetical protein
MITTTQVKRFAWVVELLLSRKQLSIREISDEWSRSSQSGFTNDIMDRKSWYKCFDDICMVYGIIIIAERKGGQSYWYILNPEVLQGRDVQNWMLACVAHRNLLEECLGLYNRIDIEGFPSENGMLKPVTLAMRGGRRLAVTYRKYGCCEPKQYVVEPYFIKTYNHRFYVLCKNDKGNFFPLSFDRIEEATVLNDRFTFPVELYAKDFFLDSFGVMIPPDDVKAIDIVIRAKDDAQFYLKDTPLHHSQRILNENADYADFKLHLRPTEDFIGAILQQGDRLEIISPKYLRERVKERLRKALEAYIK